MAAAEIAMIKVVTPNMALRVIDRAIQVGRLCYEFLTFFPCLVNTASLYYRCIDLRSYGPCSEKCDRSVVGLSRQVTVCECVKARVQVNS